MRKIAVLFGVCMLLNAAATIAVSCRESTSTAEKIDSAAQIGYCLDGP